MESFYQHNKNQLDTIKYVKYFSHYISFLNRLIFYNIFSTKFFHFFEEYSVIFFLSWLISFLEEYYAIFFLTWLFRLLNKPIKF
jgi:hypothetical protein